MRFTWDPAKNDANIAKHGIDFVDVEEVFGGPMLVRRTDRDGEMRWIGLGMLGPVLVAVVWTNRAGLTRLISARKANSREAHWYATRYSPGG